jgi:hypothetical protein
MPKSSKPRKKYRPKLQYADPVGFVVESVTPLTRHEDYLISLHVKNHEAMAALQQGKATNEHMNLLIAMSNMCEALWRLGHGVEFEDRVADGHQSLLSAGARFKRDGRVTLYAKEAEAINAMLELHDAQLSTITVGDMERALKYIRREVAAGRAKRVIKEALT